MAYCRRSKGIAREHKEFSFDVTLPSPAIFFSISVDFIWYKIAKTCNI